jgi:hypothetical protein
MRGTDSANVELEQLLGHKLYGRGLRKNLACIGQIILIRRRIVTGMPNPDKFRDSFVTKLFG